MPAQELGGSDEDRDALRGLLTIDATKWQYQHGTRQPEGISPDNWLVVQPLLDRPGNQEVQLALFYDYRTNVPLCPSWQEYFRAHRPPTLILWGANDPIFPAEGAHPYLRDLPDAEMHLLDTGHFALEEGRRPHGRRDPRVPAAPRGLNRSRLSIQSQEPDHAPQVPRDHVHRLGPGRAGALRLAGDRGNRQYVSMGHRHDTRASLFLVDYPNRRRLKLLARTEVLDAADRPDLLKRLQDPAYPARTERCVLFHVVAFDWNCPQHIPQRFTLEELEALSPHAG